MNLLKSETQDLLFPGIRNPAKLFRLGDCLLLGINIPIKYYSFFKLKPYKSSA
ncbi:hypothetical protein NO042_190003 [Flavobacterium psychrophilum]|uniref:hypothetical protein n=1 Tax=Flavobacterium psychrophilum TaxID=96345 RepID=UPI000AA8E4EF|nr:hypothetical protein [Flavobacterium psychrophilum]SNB33511.1 hypothetical protein NO042_190003 [Flavobacterium psychrophilum]